MSSPVVSYSTPLSPLLDSNGRLTREWIKWFQGVGQTVNSGFDSQGNYQGPIGADATIVGRHTLATIVQHLSDLGIIQPAGMSSATTSEQGAVVLPSGAVSNTLGTASIHPATDFDAAGSAATAQSNAEAFATSAANTAQANAEAFAGDATNLTSGTVNPARLPATVPLISFGTGAPGGTSTEGYIYFDTTGSPYHGYVFHSGAWQQFS